MESLVLPEILGAYPMTFLEWLREIGITFFGAPCTGKTTAAENLAVNYLRDYQGAPLMVVRDVGQMMRDIHAEDPTRFAQLSSGELVDSGEILALVDSIVARARREGQGIIFTGQPRKPEEAEYFLQRSYVNVVFYLHAPEKLLIKRALKRDRPDDNSLAKIRNRIRVYKEETKPILRFFEDQGLRIKKIDATRSREEVDRMVMNHLIEEYQRTIRAIAS
ncbi:nucleoside monophosphate kinase [Microgenomates group bacterium]|nr:nucleoside monophosphate kinase [Microgenomates group bacterium]